MWQWRRTHLQDNGGLKTPRPGPLPAELLQPPPAMFRRKRTKPNRELARHTHGVRPLSPGGRRPVLASPQGGRGGFQR